jgi:2-methylisocitrate lyase-like PEP mutase family enzyme
LSITFLACYVAAISPFATVQSSASSSPLFTSKASFGGVPCVGLVGISNVANNQDLMIISRHKYATTIRYVGAALQEPVSADLEDTFRAVIMLALFEVRPWSIGSFDSS